MENLEGSDDFSKLIGKSVAIFETGVPDCKSDEIFVEYQSNVKQLQLTQSGLKFLPAAESATLKPGTFCIDRLINSERNSTMSDNKRKVIVRTCRPKDLCNKIPCVRRCCRNEMMLQRVNESVKCVKYERNIKPTFHNIGSPINGLVKDYSIVEPTGKIFILSKNFRTRKLV